MHQTGISQPHYILILLSEGLCHAITRPDLFFFCLKNLVYPMSFYHILMMLIIYIATYLFIHRVHLQPTNNLILADVSLNK